MKAIYTSISLAIVFTLLSFSASAATTIMIMVDDADKGSVERSSRVSEAIVAAANGELAYGGRTVLNEEAATANIARDTKSRRTVSTILRIAQAVDRPPLDTVIILRVYVVGQKDAAGTQVRVRMLGELMTPGGLYLDNFSLQQQFRVGDCSGPCLLEEAAERGARLGRELGFILSEKVTAIEENPHSGLGEGGVEQGYTLFFDGFSNDEVFSIEEELIFMDGYQDHRISEMASRSATIYYESTAPDTQLNGVIRRLLNAKGFNVRVGYMNRAFTIQRITKRGDGRF